MDKHMTDVASLIEKANTVVEEESVEEEEKVDFFEELHAHEKKPAAGH